MLRRSLAAIILVLAATTAGALPRDLDPPRDPITRIIKFIKHLIQGPMDESELSQPKP
jgi:hypothetical protein